jgi:DNA-binding NtrC family response regulator
MTDELPGTHEPAASPARGTHEGPLLLVDDDPVFRATAVAALRRAALPADGVETAEGLLDAIRRGSCACAILGLGGARTLPLLRRIRALAPLLRVVVLTDRDDPQETIAALRLGAAEVVAKGVSQAALCAVARQTLAAASAWPSPREAAPRRAGPAPAEPAPRAAESLAPARPARAAAQRQRVLVVDDDSLIGRSIGLLLEDFDVVFAQSAAGALGRVASGHGFAAVVCDFRMPGMDGIAFHDELQRIDPALGRRVVYVTGWADAPEFRAFLGRTSCAWLPKPFQPRALRSAVACACERDG